MADFKDKKQNIYYLIIFIFSIVIAGLVADVMVIGTGYHLCENQFVDGTVFGYLVFAFVLFLSIFFEEEIPEKTALVITAMGTILYLVSGILLIVTCIDRGRGIADTPKGRLLAAAALSIVNAIIYLVTFVHDLKRSRITE